MAIQIGGVYSPLLALGEKCVRAGGKLTVSTSAVLNAGGSTSVWWTAEFAPGPRKRKLTAGSATLEIALTELARRIP
jgi:hypothetical protein